MRMCICTWSQWQYFFENNALSKNFHNVDLNHLNWISTMSQALATFSRKFHADFRCHQSLKGHFVKAWKRKILPKYIPAQLSECTLRMDVLIVCGAEYGPFPIQGHPHTSFFVATYTSYSIKILFSVRWWVDDAKNRANEAQLWREGTGFDTSNAINEDKRATSKESRNCRLNQSSCCYVVVIKVHYNSQIELCYKLDALFRKRLSRKQSQFVEKGGYYTALQQFSFVHSRNLCSLQTVKCDISCSPSQHILKKKVYNNDCTSWPNT